MAATTWYRDTDTKHRLSSSNLKEPRKLSVPFALFRYKYSEKQEQVVFLLDFDLEEYVSFLLS